MNGIEAVRAYLARRMDGCAVAPFTDALTHVHGTVGFNVLVGGSVRTVEVAYELLEPDALTGLGDHLDHVGLVELMRALEDAAILVTPVGAHPIKARGSRGRDPGVTVDARAYLIVEDEPDVADAVGSYLRNLGSAVCVVGRLEEADGILADLQFEGIVLDLHLPDGDGLTWLAKVLRGERGFGGRVVVCSGGALPDDRLDELERSGAVFLEKPFALGALAEALGIDPEPAS